jgi:hypothetical protein
MDVERVGTGNRDDEWCNGCQYCQQFAAYIIQHKLGAVVEGVEAENKRYHPGHHIRIYTWAPDYKALERWQQEIGSKLTDGGPNKLTL